MVMQKMLRQFCSFSRCVFHLEHVMVESTVKKTYKSLSDNRQVDI